MLDLHSRILALGFLAAATLASPSVSQDIGSVQPILLHDAHGQNLVGLDSGDFGLVAQRHDPAGQVAGPVRSPDGRFVFTLSADGWLRKLDIATLHQIARRRVAADSRSVALSQDGQWLAVAGGVSPGLVILRADDLTEVKAFEARNRDGVSIPVSAVYRPPVRDSFVLAFADSDEIWEIATDPEAGPFYEGFVHSREKGMIEALNSQSGLFARRRIVTDAPVADFAFTPDGRILIGTSPGGGTGLAVNLNVGRIVAGFPVTDATDTGRSLAWSTGNRQVMAVPDGQGDVTVFDTRTWKPVATIATDLSGLALRSTADSASVWAYASAGSGSDTILVIDKTRLAVDRRLRPVPGTAISSLTVTAEGTGAKALAWMDSGVVMVFDADDGAVLAKTPVPGAR